MNIVLWILQALLTLVFVGNAFAKMLMTKEKLEAKMGWKWVHQFSDGQVRLIGAAELLGAIGLVVPALTGIQPWLTPAAAFCLVALMVGAANAHARLKETIAVNVVFGVLLLVVGIGRLLV